MTRTSPARAVRLWLRCVVALAAALLTVASAGTGNAASGAGDPSRADVFQALHLDQEPADYVILVDTSGSMANDGRYDTVRATLRPFLDGLTPQDHVALLTFDSRPAARYSGPAGDTDAIVASLPPAPNRDGETDIGAALDAGLRELERDDASPVASMVLLTDGEHRPPAGSRYPRSTGGPWDDLHDRAQAVAGRVELAGYALPLGSGASGADLLGSVIGETTVLRPQSIDGLGGYLAQAGDRIRARKAARLLAPDAGRGVTATWSPAGASRTLDLDDGSATGKLTLRATTRHLPLTVSGLGASFSDPSLRVSGLPGKLALQPGASRTFQVRVHGRPGAGLLPYRRTERTDATLHVTGRVGTPWARALAPDVRPHVPDAVRVERAGVPVAATVGSAVLLPAVAGAVLLLALAGWLCWRWFQRPPLRGVLLLAPAFEEHTADMIPLTGRQTRLLPPTVGGRGQVRGRRRAAQGGFRGGFRTDLRIRYTPDGSAARESTATCPLGATVVVSGVSFSYRNPTDTRPAGTPAPGWPR